MYNIDFSHPASVYFVGIGGISMSCLAELLADAGFQVSGSDRARSHLTEILQSKGIHVFIGQRKENISGHIDCAVLTSAIRPDNPEYIALQEKQIPCLTRGELIGQLMKNYRIPIGISGTHGKTTTTSMVSEILLAAGVDPTLSIGGILKSIQSNMHIGGTDYFVTEACEYTNTFLSFFPKVGVILNIEEDHLDFFKDLEDIRRSFHKFALLLPQDGCLIINGDIERLNELTKDLACKVVTFGGDEKSGYYPADIRFEESGGSVFTLKSTHHEDRRFSLKVPGLHNIYNAMAAIALADCLGIASSVTAEALHDFSGAERRFEYKGAIGGVTIIDDYAHHPTEIRTALTAASNLSHNRLWCVFQPHTYTRTKAFMKELAQALSLADKVVLADIYAARETDTLGVSSEDLQREIQALGHECYYFPSFDEIENFLLENCINGDMLITMGAGDVVKIGENLLGK